MRKIKITGWKEGFRKVSFTKLLTDHTNLSLSEAKETTDKILDDYEVDILVDPTNVNDFVEKATEIGVLCELEE